MPKYKVDNTKVVKEEPLEPVLNSPLDKHPYLRKVFYTDKKDPKRLICTLCSENSQKIQIEAQNKNQDSQGKVTISINWLRMHLITKTHQDFTASEDKRSRW